MILILEKIKNAHIDIRVALDILEKMAERLEVGQEVDQKHLQNLF